LSLLSYALLHYQEGRKNFTCQEFCIFYSKWKSECHRHAEKNIR
jgi:hypothetical protein